MSWLDKFFSVFLGEEKADRQQEGRPVVPRQQSLDHNKEYKKIEETKVYYEYPKGKFRFPLVPDEPTRDGVYQQERRRVRQEKPKAKQTTYQSKQKIQPDVNKKPFKTEQIPSPIYGYHQDMRPKRTGPKNDAASVQMKSSEEATQRVTLLSEEAERERNVRQQMNIPSIRKENRVKAAYSASAEEKEETPFTVQEEFSQQDFVQTNMERSEHDHLMSTNETDQIRPESQEHKQAYLHEEKKEPAYDDQPIEHQPVKAAIEEQEEWRQITNDPMNITDSEDQVEAVGTLDLGEAADNASVAIDMVRERLAADETGTEEIIEVDLEEKESVPTEERQEEISVADSTEHEPVLQNNIQDNLLEDDVVAKEQESVAEPVRAQELPASQPEETTNEMHEQVQQTSVDAKQDDVKEASLQSKRSSGQTSTVPFNVMMFKSDKRMQQKKARHQQGYVFPSLALLDVPPAQKEEDGTWVKERADLLNATLKNFNVRASVVHVTQGPSVTRFEVHPEPGVKVNKITNLSDDIKLSLSAKDIRIEAPIPGKNTIGIEVPNLHSKMVFLREMVRSSAFRDNPSPLTAALGLDISGQPVVVDLQKMPHGLIAGATGSGKSVCINTILVSLMFKASPDEVKMLLIDPKMVELAPYNKIPHLVSPVITDAKTATASLKWVVDEMERRYELFAHSGVREIKRFNELVKEKQMGEKLPYLVVVIDELADLMMVAPNEVEESICRIAQKARACGIHLLIATQRPSVDVITGLIKANIPTRIAFSVSSQVDSRTIIDMAGAEKLLGKGDMLFLENGSGKPTRLQGNFVSDREIDRVVAHVRKQRKPVYLFEQEELMLQGSAITDEDELFVDACRFAIEQNSASTSSLQRRFRIGYNRAARLIDMMEREGMISGAKGSKPREVLMTLSDLEKLI
ncbi:DNA translocase FtsK [Bacillus sp. NPDC093026]|uniref:DNA translocase FtsK n=1 Tax=Bacillus sp. NPDC093026 TaxID=3363948 RepID=UPI0037F89981